MNIPGLVADWDFTRPNPYVNACGDREYRLRAEGGTPQKHANGLLLPAGCSLYVPRAEIGGLDPGRTTGEVTIIAYARRMVSEFTLACLAGIWDEAGKGRVAAVWHHLPLVGGGKSVYGHVSESGGPTPGWKFAVDGAGMKRDTPLTGRLYGCGMTYDGSSARAYLDGVTDSNPDVQIALKSLSGGTMKGDRNPYRYGKPLNRNSQAPFAVNRASRTGGTKHSRRVLYSRVIVVDRALSDAEMLQIHQEVA
jgi:hypothetical protein